MKTLHLSLTLFIAAFAFTHLARAEDQKVIAGSPAKCCAKSTAEGKTCTHGCCVAAANESKNCQKCGGKNPAKS